MLTIQVTVKACNACLTCTVPTCGGCDRVMLTYITGSRSKEKKVKRQGCQSIDEEPSLDVAESNLLWIGDDFTVVEIRRPEVYEYVDDEHDVYDEVNDDQWVGLAVGCVTCTGG